MSEPKFTKGPWTWVGQFQTSAGDFRLLYDCKAMNITVTANEAAANAALIAAAPQMYKKLGEMQKLCLEMAEYWSDNDIKHDYFEDRATEIDLLLKKARGEK